MGLAKPYQISAWLLTDEGYEEYKAIYGDNYFLKFSTTDLRDPAFTELTNSLTYLQNRILHGASVDKNFPFAIKKSKSGADYLYPLPIIQRDIAVLEKNIIDQVTLWCGSHDARLKQITYNPDDEKFVVITIDITPTAIST